MSNSALITDAAKTATRQTLSDYSAGVFAHTTGDWARHNVVKVYAQAFQDAVAHTVTVDTLRILATQGGADVAIALPINPSGQNVLLKSPPIITVQPVSQSFQVGSVGRFTVGVISDSALTYQWLKASVPMLGQITSQLVIPSVAATDVASYSVIVTNAIGSVTSTQATLSISSGAGSSSDGGFDPLDIVFAPFSLF